MIRIKNAIFICCYLFCIHLGLAQDYIANDYDRLVAQNPLTVIGSIITNENEASLLKVDYVLKSTISEVNIDNTSKLVIADNPTNTAWIATGGNNPKGCVGVWIVKTQPQNNALQPIEIIAHFIFPRSSFPEIGNDDLSSEETSNSQWAVTLLPLTKTFTRKGHFIKNISPGTVLDIKERKDSKVGELAICTLSNKKDDEFVVKTCDIIMYPGKSSEIDDETIKLCKMDGIIQAKIEIEKQRLIKQAESRNPYIRQYNSCKEKHAKYWDKVRDLQEKRDHATSKMQMQYADQLRRMKGEDIVLGQALEAATNKCNAWKQAHPVNEDNLQSPQLSALKKQLTEIHAKLNGQ